MLVVGLTGGIGSGKSTVSRLLADRGAVIVDADAITREVQEPGTPAFAAMVERFGPGIVAADGTLDRAAVADIVFADPDALADLNKIVHPAVGAEIARRMTELADTDAVVVLDVPLMVESSRGYPVAGLLVVDVDPEVALAPGGRAAGDARGRRPGPDGQPGDPRPAPGPGRPRDRQRRHARRPGATGRRGLALDRGPGRHSGATSTDTVSSWPAGGPNTTPRTGTTSV